jgi:hypothetical protein
MPASVRPSTFVPHQKLPHPSGSAANLLPRGEKEFWRRQEDEPDLNRLVQARLRREALFCGQRRAIRSAAREQGDRTMKKILIPAIALAAAAVAVPASAQVRVTIGTAPAYGQAYGYGNAGYGYDRNWRPIQQRIANIDRRIDQGARRGQLTRREAQSLRAELSYVRGGLSWRERQDIDHRLDRVEQRLRYERRDGDRRGSRGRW